MGKFGPIAIARGNQISGRLAHMSDPKTKEQTPKSNRAFIINRSKQVLCRFIAPSIAIFQAGQIGTVPRLKRENIRRFINRQNGIGKKHFNLLGPQSVNIKGLARHKML